MRIEINGGRFIRVIDVQADQGRWATISFESGWPSLSAVFSKLTPSELRAIAAECTRVADLLDPDVITSTKAA